MDPALADFLEDRVTNFFVGLFLANALAHLIIAQTGVRFLSPFGFSSRGNTIYSGVNLALAIGLALIVHGHWWLIYNFEFWGAFFVVAAYALVGRALFRRWGEDRAQG